MRRALPVLLPLLLFACGQADTAERPDMLDSAATVDPAEAIPDPTWSLSDMARRLIGEWQDVQPDGKTVFHEQWRRTDDAFYAGLGFVLSGTDTVFIEHLNIHWDDTGAYYSARIPSQNGGRYVDFVLAHLDGDSVLFVNPEHDFPQRIRYAVEGDGWNVEVSGMENDTLRTETFHLTRRPADGASTAAIH